MRGIHGIIKCIVVTERIAMSARAIEFLLGHASVGCDGSYCIKSILVVVVVVVIVIIVIVIVMIEWTLLGDTGSVGHDGFNDRLQ